MLLYHYHVPLSLLWVAPALADFLGPSYPPPADLSSNQSLVATAWSKLTSNLQTYIDHDTGAASQASAGISNITFSLGLFSLNDQAASKNLQYHYTSPEVINSPNGTHKVDGDSIYRVASVTKLFTVYAALLNLKPADWDRPFTDIFPVLAEYVKNHPSSEDPTRTIAWDEVTVSALSAQIAGVGRDISPFNPSELYSLLEAVQQAGLNITASSYGLPLLSANDTIAFPPCISLTVDTCTTDLYLQGGAGRPPTFRPWTSPGYADNGFVLLGMAIAAITGKDLYDIFQDSIFTPLGMSSSNSTTPPVSEWYRSVIPGDPAVSFAYDSGLLISTGTLLSTINDLAKFGVAILNSTLLPAAETRRWLKPVTFTDRLQYAVGRPWEIFRYVHPSGHITDIYTKSGDSGSASAWLALLPDYNAGFSILTSSNNANRTKIAEYLADQVASTVVPALQAQSAKEAALNFAGTYTSTVPGLNSSLVLVANQTETSAPGLVIQSWISDGIDVPPLLYSSYGSTPWRLLPTIVDTHDGKLAFRLVSATDAPRLGLEPRGKLFSGPGYLGADWIDVDSTTYGGIALSLFIFDTGADGKAVSVSPAALRVQLDKSA